MKVLVACEFSGVVRRAFRKRGHDAWSCDLLPSEDDSPYHYQLDVGVLLISDWWDLIIAHPPCTDLASSGARWWKQKGHGAAENAVNFAKQFMDYAPKVCIENPVGRLSTLWRPPDQIIQPWMFGHPEVKTTCLWLKGLPHLYPTFIVDGRFQRVWKMGETKNRARERSRTYEGVAKAMAAQWG